MDVKLWVYVQVAVVQMAEAAEVKLRLPAAADGAVSRALWSRHRPFVAGCKLMMRGVGSGRLCHMHSL